jgi:hypothetical protein
MQMVLWPECKILTDTLCINDTFRKILFYVFEIILDKRVP